ncbi:S8 family serine peptidase [Pseudomonas abieticivorans]|uniref:S8 family serine peptidase n=1 Tax=Pseudomonas abieticivorans TaxID=2931382 RepID=UPI0020C092AF|nr:S8 family serine peptidase [Pseudomonas sp. PIA16]
MKIPRGFWLAIGAVVISLMPASGATSDWPGDPLFDRQGYLHALNIPMVWQHFTGRGVRIGQFEAHSTDIKAVFDYRHPDLAANIDPAWQASSSPWLFPSRFNSDRHVEHATAVAGVMAAARNGQGVVGVAYDATLGGHWLKRDLSSLRYLQRYDVANLSWGSEKRFGLWLKMPMVGAVPREYSQALSEGRGGLGTVIVMSAGNERQQGGNANYSNLSNMRGNIMVAASCSSALAARCASSGFSNPGANLLVSAPGVGIMTTSQAAEHYREHSGTSLAAPMVSGVAALMLQANPALGYRDVQDILAMTARRVSDPSSTWQINGSHEWNGGGMHVSHDYGYGEVDALAAVRLAQHWPTTQRFGDEALLQEALASRRQNLAIPDNDPQGIAYRMTLLNARLRVEHVQVRVELEHERAGDLVVTLVSPKGTRSVLIDRPGRPPAKPDDLGDLHFARKQRLDFTFSTALLRGEPAAGQWELHVSDRAAGKIGQLRGWSLNAFGRVENTNDHYVYTNEFAEQSREVGRQRLEDRNGGIDTLNAAAISSASLVDLSTGQARLAGADLTVVSPEQIEHLIGGDYADVLIGNAADNVLVGGKADDLLQGGDGDDTLLGGTGNDRLSGGRGRDTFVIAAAAQQGDTLLDFTPGEDRLLFTGFAAHSPIEWLDRGQDTLVKLPGEQFLLLRGVAADTLSADDWAWREGAVTLDLLAGKVDLG